MMLNLSILTLLVSIFFIIRVNNNFESAVLFQKFYQTSFYNIKTFLTYYKKVLSTQFNLFMYKLIYNFFVIDSGVSQLKFEWHDY